MMTPCWAKSLKIVWICSAFFLQLCIACSDPGNVEKMESEQKKGGGADAHHGGIYRVPLLQDPETLDPVYVQDQFGVTVVQQIFNGLVKFDNYLAILPDLADSWTVTENGRVYVFKLNKAVHFHNGKPLGTEDVVYSIQRLLRSDPSPVVLPQFLKIVGAEDYRNRNIDQVTGIEPLGDGQIQFRLVEPHVPFLAALGMYQAKIVPKPETGELGAEFSRHPIGSGPFQMAGRQDGQTIRLTRYADYHNGKAYLDEILYTIYPGGDIKQVYTDFMAGSLEEMPVYGYVRQAISENDRLQHFHRPSLSLLFYGIRVDHPLLNKSELRQALSLAIDREKLVKEVYGNQFVPAKTILPPGMPGFQGSQQLVAYDPEKAKTLVARIQETEPQPLPQIEIISASKSAFAQKELGLVRQFWEAIGLDISIRYITDWAEFRKTLQNGKAQIYRYAWFADVPDPDNFLHPLFASDSPQNHMGYKDSDIDQLLLEARGITDSIKRIEQYRQIESRIAAATPLLPMFYLSVDRVYQPNVNGIHPSALGAHVMPLKPVWLQRQPTPG